MQSVGLSEAVLKDREVWANRASVLVTMSEAAARGEGVKERQQLWKWGANAEWDQRDVTVSLIRLCVCVCVCVWGGGDFTKSHTGEILKG